jgi:putative transposase
MGSVRRRYDAKFKAKVAFEAAKQEKTVAQLSGEYGVHPNLITQWKKRLVAEIPGIFSEKQKRGEKKTEEIQSELYRQIGQLKVELDWVKKKYHQLT